MPYDSDLRRVIDQTTYAEEAETVARLTEVAGLSEEDRVRISKSGADLVRRIRNQSDPGLMEVFLAEYGLSTDEGIALMCLAEALLRVPDADTIDALIEDKIAPSDWGKHMGHSTSPLVNASTWALMLTGKVLKDDNPGPVGHLRGAIRRLGEPVIRTAVGRAMREMGRQFVLGETIESAMDRAAKMEKKGYTYSYDMLGEAARTDADAIRYHLAYSRAISAISNACTHKEIRKNPGISVKLSALHPRYEVAQQHQVMDVLMPRLRSLAILAKSARMGLNIDAEEADRLSLSLEVIEATLSEPSLAGWDGFGVVVQAYGQRASHVLDYLHDLSQKLNRRIMVRLVKGAYWDTEIKQAQVEGIDGFPVFTSKPATDISYIANARKLLSMTDHIYPQFATHNAHTVAAILDMAREMEKGPETFEFQRLHGMGESLHNIVMKDHGTNCRIYAPVGAHRDLLAYLVRRLLENGANSSFVNQIVDEDVAPETVARDPFEAYKDDRPQLPTGPELFLPERPNSKGFDLKHQPTLDVIEAARRPLRQRHVGRSPADRGQGGPGRPRSGLEPRRPFRQPRHRRNGQQGRHRNRAVLGRALGRLDRGARENPQRRRRSLRGKIRRDLRHPRPRGRQDPDGRRGRTARGRGLPALLRRQRAAGPARGHLHLHQPVELPAGDLHRPDQRRPGCRQRRARQTGRADSADRPLRHLAHAQGRRAENRRATPARRGRRGRGAHV